MKGLNKRSARVGSLLLPVLLCFSVVVYGCLRFLTGLDMMSGRSYYCLSSCAFLRLFTVVYGRLRLSAFLYGFSWFHGITVSRFQDCHDCHDCQVFQVLQDTIPPLHRHGVTQF